MNREWEGATSAQPAPNISPVTVEESTSTPTTGKLDRRYVTAALMLVMVLASMEQTVTSTAMPTIIGDLHGLEHYSWVASIYLLACTVTMPLYGRLADALGRKRVIIGAILIFVTGSVLASFAHSMTQLIIFRGIQGLGAGGIMPVVLTILGDIFTLAERAKIQGFFSAVWGTSALAGPALGAALVNGFGWRSIFFVNLPFAVIGLAVLIWKYHDHERPHSVDLDLPGVISLSVGCVAILCLFQLLNPNSWSWLLVGALTVIACGCITFFIFHERRAERPIMPAKLLLDRAIGPSILGSFLFGIGFLSLDTYVPLYVQGARGGGATAAAGVVTPVFLTWAASGVIAAPLIVRWGFRRVALAGASLIIVGFTGLLLGAVYQAPHWMLTAILSITGFGFGPTSMSYLIAAQEAVTYQYRGSVTSSISFFRTIGGAVGIGVLGTLFNILIAGDLASLAAEGVRPAELLDPHSANALAPDTLHFAQQMMANGLIWVFGGMLLFAVLQLLVTLMMSPRKVEHAISKSEAIEAMA
ncbi:MAG TPA: MFS transporter [Tepidisphaeraceae bacterium]|nr:MFS transporter [Tepidisphaeraceae bacterium]